MGFVKGRVSEALRIAEKSPLKQQVLPYYWFKYQDRRDDFLSKVSLSELLEMFTLAETLVSNIYLHRKIRRTHSTRLPVLVPMVWLFGAAPKIRTRNRNARIYCST